MNIGGAVPGKVSISQHGMPGRASMVFGELEEENPWEPFAVARGIPPGKSAVTAFVAYGTMPVHYHIIPQQADDLVLIITHCLEYIRGYNITPMSERPGALVLLTPSHALAFSRQGWSKGQLELVLTEAVNRDLNITLSGAAAIERLRTRGLDSSLSPQLPPQRPKDPVHVMVAGGTGGWHSSIILVGGAAAPMVTKLVAP
jgi:hypothetical protein